MEPCLRGSCLLSPPCMVHAAASNLPIQRTAVIPNASSVREGTLLPMGVPAASRRLYPPQIFPTLKISMPSAFLCAGLHLPHLAATPAILFGRCPDPRARFSAPQNQPRTVHFRTLPTAESLTPLVSRLIPLFARLLSGYGRCATHIVPLLVGDSPKLCKRRGLRIKKIKKIPASQEHSIYKTSRSTSLSLQLSRPTVLKRGTRALADHAPFALPTNDGFDRSACRAPLHFWEAAL